MKAYDSTKDTLKHIKRVKFYIKNCVKELHKRAKLHDHDRIHNSTEKALFDNAIQGNENGVPQVIVSSNLLEETENGIIELTSPNDTDKLQYLSKLYEDFWRRFFNLYGMTTQGSEKMAQMSEKEINNGSNSSMIIPCDRLEERKKGIEKVNEMFSTNIEVDFSECWKREIKKRESEVNVNDTDK